MTCLESLAHFAAGIQFDSLPQEIIDRADRCIAESLQNMLCKENDSRRTAALSCISSFSCEKGIVPKGLVRLPGGKATIPEDAAFYLSVCISVDPRLDSHRLALCHPGSVAVPVALALAQALRLDGKRIVEALVAGYEAMIRLGLTLRTGTLSPAVRRTALCAAFCGAVTAGKMLGLSEHRLALAASLACHFSFGLNEWAITGSGEDAYQSAWGAKTGIFCARMAQEDAPSSLTNLEGEKGLFEAYGVKDGSEVFLSGIGEEYLISEIEHKPIDACLLLQSPCQLAARIRKSHALKAEEIESIVIEAAPQIVHHSGMSRSRGFTTEGQTTNSIPFGVSAHLLLPEEDVVWHPPFSEEILSLSGKCRLEVQPSYTDSFPKTFPCRISIILRDKSEISDTLEDYLPMTNEAFQSMLASTLRSRFSEEQTAVYTERISHISRECHITDVLQVLY